jgi:dCMP deaminase
MNNEKCIKFYKLAQYNANLFSKDPNKKVGAILLAPNSFQILSIGYNGMPRNINENVSTRWERPVKYKYIEHAERNAVYNACRHGTALEGSIAVVTMFPCCDCARALIQVGISTLITEAPNFEHPRWGEDFHISREMFDEAGVKVTYVSSLEQDKN